LGFVAPATGRFGRPAIEAATGVAEATVARSFAAATATAATHAGRATATAFAAATAATAAAATGADTATAAPSGDQLGRPALQCRCIKGQGCTHGQGHHTGQHQPESRQGTFQGVVHWPTPLQPSS
jgi:hypothetical protein